MMYIWERMLRVKGHSSLQSWSAFILWAVVKMWFCNLRMTWRKCPKQKVIEFKRKKGVMFWVTALTATEQSHGGRWEPVDAIIKNGLIKRNNNMLNLTTPHALSPKTNVKHMKKKWCQDSMSYNFNKCRPTLGSPTRHLNNCTAKTLLHIV